MDTTMPSEIRLQVEAATLDESLHDEDWPAIQSLWQSGASNRNVYDLLRLRLRYRRASSSGLGQHLDGFVPDARALFARWLVENGHLHEDA